MATTDDNVLYTIADPDHAGVDQVAVDALMGRARREIDEGLLPSCQLALAHGGRLVMFATIGDAAPSSRYPIFSCTKALVAGAVWLLLDEGRLRLDARVGDLVPEFATNDKDTVTVEQLLVHTGGFPHAPLDPRVVRTREQRLARFGQWRLNWEPGTRFEYHPTSAHWVLAELIERSTGQDHRRFVHERVIAPLGLRALRLGAFEPGEGAVNEGVVVGAVPTPEEIEAAIGIPGIDLTDLTGEVTTDALLAFNDPEVQALGVPGAGAVSTAADLALFYQALLHDPVGLWRPATLAAGTEQVRSDLPDEVLGVPSHRSLGLSVAGAGATAARRGFGRGVSPRTFGHDGAGGQLSWADPVSGLSFAYLTNGYDRDVLREARRRVSLSSRAAACALP